MPFSHFLSARRVAASVLCHVPSQVKQEIGHPPLSGKYVNCKDSAEYKQLGCMVKTRLIPDNVLLEPCGISRQPPTVILNSAFFLLIDCNWQSLVFTSVAVGSPAHTPVLSVVLPSVSYLFAW